MFKFVAKVNQILFFVLALLLIAIFVNELYGKWKPRKPYSSPKVSLVDPETVQVMDVERKQELNLVEILNGVYIFSVENEIIDLSRARESESAAAFRVSGYGHYSDNTVNYIFANISGYKKVLLEKDALITRFFPANFGEYKETPLFEKNIYYIVESDSNNDGFLTGDDSKSLYISDFDGQNMRLVLGDISHANVIDEDVLVIVTGKGRSKAFYHYSVKDSKLYQLDVGTKLTGSSG